MSVTQQHRLGVQGTNRKLRQLEVVIEISRGSFLKRGSTGQVDFVSPFPCPFNYGSVDKYVGLGTDLLDAVVLGRRLWWVLTS